MFRKTKIALAAGVGYVLGPRAGRTQYDALVTSFGGLRETAAAKAQAATQRLRSTGPSAPSPSAAAPGTAPASTAPAAAPAAAAAAPVEPVPEGVEVYPQTVVDRRHGADVTDVTHLPAETDPLEITADFYEENPPA